jgi:hypothetical protein
MAAVYKLQQRNQERRQNVDNGVEDEGVDDIFSEMSSDESDVDMDEEEQSAPVQNGQEEQSAAAGGQPQSNGLLQGSGSRMRSMNRQKVLVLSTRGTSNRQRYLMNNMISLMPHAKKDAKFDTKTKLFYLNDLAELYNCNNVLLFEARKRGQDLYLWLAKAPNGPTAKLHVQNCK